MDYRKFNSSRPKPPDQVASKAILVKLTEIEYQAWKTSGLTAREALMRGILKGS